MSKEFIFGAESLMELFMKRLVENGGLCASCKKNIGEVYEVLMGPPITCLLCQGPVWLSLSN
jgi:hypothetical protein